MLVKYRTIVATLLLAGSGFLVSPVFAAEGHEHHQHASKPQADPHAQHKMSASNMAKDDPHAHHKMQGSAVAEGDPHAQHKNMLPSISGDDDPHAHHKAMAEKKTVEAESTRVELHDRQLLDQDGKKVKFVSDIIGDNIVVIDFMYTSCTAICPVISAIFTQVQGKLGDEMGQGVSLVSMTVDPIRDTPKRLKAFSKKHGAKEGWVWLTGKKRVVDEVLDGLGAYTTNFEDHPAMVLVGDGRTGEWSRFFGFPNPDRIVKEVERLKAKRKMVM